MSLAFYTVAFLPEFFYLFFMKLGFFLALFITSCFFLANFLLLNSNSYFSGIFQIIVFGFIVFLSKDEKYFILLLILNLIIIVVYWIKVIGWNYYLKKLPEIYPEIFQDELIRNHNFLSGIDFSINKSNLANIEKDKVLKLRHKNFLYKFRYE